MFDFLRRMGFDGTLCAQESKIGQRLTVPQIMLASTHLFDTKPELEMIDFPKPTKELNCEICSCAQCGTSKPHHQFYLFDAKMVYCTPGCYIKKVLKDTSLVSLLRIKKRVLLPEEINRLKLFASILYFCELQFSPSNAQDESLFYALDHYEIARALAAISSKTSVTKDLKELGLDLVEISEFYKKYGHAKVQHVQKIASILKKITTEEEFQAFDRPFFSENGVIENLKIVAQQEILSALHCGLNSSSLFSLYRELVSLICNRLGVTDFDYLTCLIKNGENLSPKKLVEQAVSKSVVPAGQAFFVNDDSDNEEAPPDFIIAPTQLVQLSDMIQFKALSKAKKINHAINCVFAKKCPYKISLYKVNKKREGAEKIAFDRLMESPHLKMAPRVRAPFDIVDSLDITSCDVAKNDFGNLCLLCPTVEGIVAGKLNIDHLFDLQVDRLLSYGILELDGKSFRVSLPGEIREESGRLTVGFFQYTFNESLICYHRCFVNFDSNVGQDVFVTPRVRKALYDYLISNCSTDHAYEPILKKLKSLLFYKKVRVS